MRSWLSIAVFCIAVGWPRWGLTCAVCFDGENGTRVAFLLTTALLTLTPLFLIGGVLWWIRRRLRELEGLRSPGSSDTAPQVREEPA